MRCFSLRVSLLLFVAACAARPVTPPPSAADQRLKNAMAAFVRVAAGRTAVERCDGLDLDRKTAFLKDYRQDIVSLENGFGAEGMPLEKIPPVIDYLTAQGAAYAHDHFADCTPTAEEAEQDALREARCIPRYLANAGTDCLETGSD